MYNTWKTSDEKYRMALKMNPDKAVVYCNWAIAVMKNIEFLRNSTYRLPQKRGFPLLSYANRAHPTLPWSPVVSEPEESRRTRRSHNNEQSSVFTKKVFPGEEENLLKAIQDGNYYAAFLLASYYCATHDYEKVSVFIP